jgi:hypothetical protein
MKHGNYYSNEHQIQKNNFGKNLTLVKKEKGCTCDPVSNDKIICYATLDLIIYILDIDTLKLIKELNLNNIKDVKKNKKKKYIQLFLINNILNILIIKIEIANQYFKFDIESDKLDLLMNNKSLIVISDSVLFNNNLYFESNIDEKYTIESLNYNLCKNEEVVALKDVSQFLIGTEQKLFAGVDDSVLCYDLISKNEIWQTPIAHYGDYYDEIWEKKKRRRHFKLSGNS